MYIAIDNVCAWPNLTLLPDGVIIAAIYNQPCHGTWEGDLECWSSAGLSFLGLGVLPPTSSWGSMLNAANSMAVMERNWWMWIPPGIAVLLTVMAINFAGDGLRDALDPRTEMR